jgi:major outer membrane protein P.IB
MNRDRISIAVCSALGMAAVPAAHAQNVTVNVYGRLYAEYAHYSHVNESATEQYQNVGYLGNPGSRIGFRGQEKLGGGLSAWFQCETTLDFRGSANRPAGATAQGICNRDSALGIKGAFGNFFAGQWGTPFKRVNSDETGAFGVARLL